MVQRSSIAVAKLLATCLAALALAGCGGGGTARPQPIVAPPPAPTPTPTPVPTPTPTPTANFDTAEARRSDGVIFHGAITAYQAGASGQGIIAGVVDSGIDQDSPEFAGRISAQSADVAGSRGINDEDDDHGTHVAQILLGAKDNVGTQGIAYQATLLVLRADRPGSCASEVPGDDETGCRFPETAIAAGIDRGVSAGAKVINISLGGGDAPGAALRAAVARATAAGVVIVASAGNSGDTTADGNNPNNPELFAQGLRDSGGSLVILAGSVGDNRAISGFSNRAGTYATSFLAALGDGVCCVYENGRLKTETRPDGTVVFLLSGTSFAAPQISGAIALIAQAFPTLTGEQIVNLLFQSARDAGVAGDDNIFGQGILDIARAFQPLGATSLAGSTTAIRLDGAMGTLGAPMGDARGAGATGLITDSYGRAFDVDFGGALATRRPDLRLFPALGGATRQLAAASAFTSLSLTVTPDGRRMQYAATAPLSAADLHQSRALAASIITRLDNRTRIGFAAGRSTSGLAAGERGDRAAAMLVSDRADEGLGFGARSRFGTLLRRDMGRVGALTLTSETGDITAHRRPDEVISRLLADRDHRYDLVRLGWDKALGDVLFAASAAWLREDNTLLGGELGVFGHGGAASLVGDASIAAALPAGWSVGGAWRQMWTRPDRQGLVGGGALWSSAFSLDVGKDGVLGAKDRLALRLSQPLRVAGGGLRLTLPVAYDYATRSAEVGIRRFNLAPTGREVAMELAYQRPLAGGLLTANGWWRRDPGHFAETPDDLGGAIRFTHGF